MRLIILTTHPIQYQVPLWQALARDGRVPFEVWYLTRHGVEASHDREFGKSFAWDLNSLSGYPHQFLNVMEGASPNTFWKCRLRESLATQLRASEAKALWVQGWQVAAYWQAVWAAKRAGVEVWLRAESNDLSPTPMWKRGIKRIILSRFLKRVDRFLCIGTANRRLYQRYGVPEHRLYSAPYAVDNERFARQAEAIRKPSSISHLPSSAASSSRSTIRREWNIPEDAFCVLFCGKFIPKKRPLDLVRAAALLPAPCSLHLLFVGSGELGAQLRNACHVAFDAEKDSLSASDGERAGVRCVPQPSTLNPQLPSPISHLPSPTSSLPAPCSMPPASFPGFLNQTEISKAYVAADCLVLPSDYGETWGLVVNEAMASGLPCIISDRCGCAEDLGTPPNAVVPCGDVAALADCLSKIAGRREASVLQPPSLDETVGTIISLFQNRR